MTASRAAAMGRKLTTALAWYRCIHSTFTCGCIIGCMALRALLMRLFLVVALLANGPGVAGASMHLEHLRNSGDLSDVAAVQAAAEAITACHGAEATAPAAVDHGPPQATNEAGDASPADDCCRAGDCCACMHHCSAALAWSMLADLSTGYRQTAEPFLSGHASAARANLLRPPIG
ncbi:CopL family metal-binding regulatory protein [Thermomonas fusca]|uniref:CopL family metal-binding regulatory protein n=2 Tax=Lysobacteraceae TaxID=32033 RepID=A0A5R9PCJ2_9GAMM|nr:CopL family metal-binding regulatory protein [Thermomonas fusca]